jgi:hypothetical protein
MSTSSTASCLFCEVGDHARNELFKVVFAATLSKLDRIDLERHLDQQLAVFQDSRPGDARDPDGLLAVLPAHPEE